MPWSDVLLATLAGGAVLFVWGAISWVALPHHHGDFRAFPKDAEDAVTDALARTGAEPGMYMVPHYANYAGFKDPALTERYERGPNGQVLLIPGGDCMQGSTFVYGFLLNLLVAFAAVVLYANLDPILCDGRRLLLFAGLGALVHGAPGLQQVVWMKHPLRDALTATFDGVVGFVLLALTFSFVL
jgi:hypothetical protein